MSIIDYILGADDLAHEPVHVPEWGVTLHLWEMTGIERNGWVQESADQTVSDASFRVRLLVRAIRDSEGMRVFTDNQVDVLGKKSSRVLDRLYRIAARLNGLRDEDKDEAAKN